MKRARSALVAIAWAAVVTVSAPALRAQSSEAVAEALFDEGRGLMGKGSYASACDKFAASYNLSKGLGALLNLAHCRLKNGQAATAWGHARATLAEAKRVGDVSRERAANDLITQIEPQLAKLTIAVNEPTAGLVVERDGVPIELAALGTAIPVDPGLHVIKASAPGRTPWTNEVRVEAGPARVLVTIPTLPPAPVERGVAQRVEPPRTVGPAQEASRTESSSALRTTAYVVGGAGVASLAASGVFGLFAKSSWSDAKRTCDSSFECDHDGAVAGRRASDQATVATVAGVAGVALVATAVVLLVVAPSRGAARAVQVRNGFAF